MLLNLLHLLRKMTMHRSKIQIVVMDGEIAYIIFNGNTVRNLNCEPKSILEVKDVDIYEAEIPAHGVVYDDGTD